MDTDVTSVTVLDRHSGTTGRAHLAIGGDPRLPATVFVKLAPFDERQRKFVNVQGMGVVEARLYRDLAHELPGSRPAGLVRGVRRHRPRRRRPLRDGARRPRRLGLPLPRPGGRRHRSAHHRHRRAARVAPRGSTGRARASRPTATWRGSRRVGTAGGDGGASMVQMAIDNLADRLPEGFVPLAEAYVERSQDVLRAYREGECTLVHGDPHLGNLFVDGEDPTRTGFLDWAVVSRAPGVRDVAYVLSASTPTELRRTQGTCIARAVPRSARRARRHARRRPRVGAVPALHDLRLVLARCAPRRWVPGGSPSTSGWVGPSGARSRRSIWTVSA